MPENKHYCFVLTPPVGDALTEAMFAASRGRAKRATWDETFRWLLAQAGRPGKEAGG